MQSLFWNPPYCDIFDRAIVHWMTCRKNFCSSALCSRVFLVFVHQNFRHQKKSFKNTWKDLQRRRCSTSWAVLPCSARPLGPTRRANVDKRWQDIFERKNQWQKITWDEKKENRTTKDFQPWSCGRWQESAYNRGSQVRLSNAPTERKMQIKKKQLAKHLN